MSASPSVYPEPTPAEMRELVTRIAAEPDSWRHLVRHDPDRRTYEQISRDGPLGLWVICWMNDHDTGFHDHDISSGAVCVIDGAIKHERLVIGGEPSTVIYGPGDAFCFDASEVHRMSHWGDVPAVTIHAYSPPLWRMGAYATDDDGTLHRHSISYAEELRPVLRDRRDLRASSTPSGTPNPATADASAIKTPARRSTGTSSPSKSKPKSGGSATR